MIKQPFNWPAFKCETHIQTHTLMHIPLVAEVEGIRGAGCVHMYVWKRIVFKRNRLEYFFYLFMILNIMTEKNISL